MEREIALINELEEKAFSEENLSDTSYEEEEELNNGSACPSIELAEHPDHHMPEPPLKRLNTYELITAASQKDRIRTSNQLALVHLRKLYSHELEDIIKQSQESILDLFEFISGDILNIEIRLDTQDDATGNKILKAVYLLNIIKDNFTVCLKKESISRFLAKAFEYLLNFDYNYEYAAKILHIMNQLKYRAFDLKYVAQMFKLRNARDILLIKVFERSIYQMSNLKIAQDIKNYTVQTWLKLISKINIVFKDDFKALYDYTDENNIKYLDDDGVSFSYYFIPAKHLNKHDFEIMLNEIMFFRTSDIKMKSKDTVAVDHVYVSFL